MIADSKALSQSTRSAVHKIIVFVITMLCEADTTSLHTSIKEDRLCGLVVRVPGYRTRGSRFDSRRYHIF
jgi:hypothetical protein